MEVWPRYSAGSTDRADDSACLDSLAGSNRDRRAVAVVGREPFAMVDNDQVSIRAVRISENHHPSLYRSDRSAFGGGEINTAVVSMDFEDGVLALAKVATDGGCKQGIYEGGLSVGGVCDEEQREEPRRSCDLNSVAQS